MRSRFPGQRLQSPPPWQQPTSVLPRGSVPRDCRRWRKLGRTCPCGLAGSGWALLSADPDQSPDEAGGKEYYHRVEVDGCEDWGVDTPTVYIMVML